MITSPIPPGYHSITPYIIVHDGNAAIEFYQKAFGATEQMRMDAPGGKIGHAEVKIGDSIIMLADEHPDMGFVGPKTVGGVAGSLMIYTENVDEMYQRAIDLGATVKRPVENQFYGDRSGIVEDPFGHVWNIATHVEDVPPDELNRRMAELYGGEQK